MESRPGTYVLVLHSDRSACVHIGRWGLLDIRPGYYVYVGSAFGPGGVLARVSRHCRVAKSKRWHIDYLREFTILKSVWYSHSTIRLECRWAEALAELSETEKVKGFGCSDCKCESHLFFTAGEPNLAKFASFVHDSVKTWSCERSS